MEPPNDPFGGSKHLGWNNHSLTTRSDNDQVVLKIRAGRICRRRASDSEEARKIHVMLVNVGQCWSMLVNVGQCWSMLVNGFSECRTFASSEKISGERAKRAVPLLTFHFSLLNYASID
jgi:hypothetical protein